MTVIDASAAVISQELGLITGMEDEEESSKCKQRLTDKVRHVKKNAEKEVMLQEI